MKRRQFIAAAAAAALTLPARAQSRARVVVAGGGFAGATCARALRKANPRIAVTLLEANDVFTACPFSNEVIVGLRELTAQQFRYGALEHEGIRVVKGAATEVDPDKRTVAIADGPTFGYDRLVIAPGIDMRWNAIPGYDAQAAERMPHAWKAGPQTTLLRSQLESMPNGALVVIAVPAYPYRCPSAPYERASLIAHFIKTRKPRSKLLILDSKDGFSQQRLFQEAWTKLYSGIVEWAALSQGGAVIRVNASAGTVDTDFEEYRPAVANIIPPQKAGHLAEIAGVADSTGWCPVDPVSFESKLVPRIHVIGDSIIGGAMPKSAYSATSQGKACANAIARLLAGRSPSRATLGNACYSLLGPEYGISQSASYRADGSLLVEIPDSFHMSALEASAAERKKEAQAGEAWLRTVTTEAFG